MENIKELELREIQKKEYAVLKEFDLFCKNNKLKYTLAGGSLLGCVRHNGFIPWDDDIDVSMPREDYNYLINNYNNNNHFKIVSIYNNENYGLLHARMYDDRTLVVDEVIGRNNFNIGIFIDIFPIDNLGETQSEAMKNFNKNIFLKNILIASNWVKFESSKTHSIIYEPVRLIFYIISRFYNPNRLAKKLDSIFSSGTGMGKKYQGVHCGVYKNKEVFDANIYDKVIKMKFEDGYFCCIEQYDYYLKRFYGNYLMMPPISKRVHHHTFKAYNIK